MQKTHPCCTVFLQRFLTTFNFKQTPYKIDLNGTKLGCSLDPLSQEVTRAQRICKHSLQEVTPNRFGWKFWNVNLLYRLTVRTENVSCRSCIVHHFVFETLQSLKSTVMFRFCSLAVLHINSFDMNESNKGDQVVKLLANEDFLYIAGFCRLLRPHSYEDESRACESGAAAAAGCWGLSVGWQQTRQFKKSWVSHETDSAKADRLGKAFD